MTVVSQAIIETLAVVVAPTSQYTSPPSTRTIVDKMVVTNTTAGALLFTAYLVPSGGAVGASTKVINAQSVAAGASYLCPEVAGHTLNAGDAIQTEASALGLTLRASGRAVS